MAETKHKPREERAAAKTIALAIWPEERGFTEEDSWISQKIAEFTIIIKETATVDLQAKIDRLEAEKKELLKTLTDMASYIKECEKLGQIQPMQAKAIREVVATVLAKAEPQ